MKKIIFAIFVSGLIFGGFNFVLAYEGVEVDFFYSPTCLHCAKEKIFLRELAEKVLPEGHWVHSSYLSSVDAAYEWGIRPSVMGICLPEDDLTIMLAYLETKRLIDAIDTHFEAERMRKDRAAAEARNRSRI